MIALFSRVTRHWLLASTSASAPSSAAPSPRRCSPLLGWSSLAASLYAAYHLACHQWAFRSFFLFGAAARLLPGPARRPSGSTPSASPAAPGPRLEDGHLRTRPGDLRSACSVVGLVYARRRAPLRPHAHVAATASAPLPMAVDGFTQLFGWRESTWELRVATGLLFGARQRVAGPAAARRSAGRTRSPRPGVCSSIGSIAPEPACEPPSPAPSRPRVNATPGPARLGPRPGQPGLRRSCCHCWSSAPACAAWSPIAT